MALMDAGEKLIARFGFDGVTLRDISELAGQANTSVVQYHFKDKAGLIHAILQDRANRREALRREQLEKLVSTGRQNDPRQLLAALWLPSLAARDEDGRHLGCHFSLQCLLRGDLLDGYPIAKFYEDNLQDTKGEPSVLAEVMDLLSESCPDLPPRLLSQRLSALSLMFISSVVEFDNNCADKSARRSFDPQPLLDIALLTLRNSIDADKPALAGRSRLSISQPREGRRSHPRSTGKVGPRKQKRKG